MKGLEQFDEYTKQNILEWLKGPIDETTKNAIRRLLEKDPKALEDAFFQRLSFGTGGVRALMGIGTNRLNQYTVRSAMQGLVNYLLQNKNPSLRVLIGFDNRHNSRFFAEESAKVFAGNGIKTFLFRELRPSPLVSFGCRYFQCGAGIMISASHNPPEYNGFKIYWKDGGQVVPPHDQKITEEMNRITNLSQIKITPSLDHPLIEEIQDQIDKAYLAKLPILNHFPQKNMQKGKNLHITYSNLHGAGITVLPKALEQWGFSSIHLVEEQKNISGDFPNAPIPNPEEKKTLALGISLMLKNHDDLFLATDPDADRIAVVVNHHDKAMILSGNQLGCILLDHLCRTKTDLNTMPKNAAFVKSIVTTELFKTIVEDYKKNCFDTLTGFKYIAALIEQWEKSKEYAFIFGAEESYGYLAVDFVRDKDAISTAALICEAALQAKNEKKTLIDSLYSLYAKYGIYRESTFSISLNEGKEALNTIDILMRKLRKDPPTLFANYEVTIFEDYLSSYALDYTTKKRSDLFLPKSDVLRFRLNNKSTITIRPSGTEPKIKIYLSVIEKNPANLLETIPLCDKRLEALADAVQNEIKSRYEALPEQDI